MNAPESQVAHAAIDVFNRMPKNNGRYQQWKREGQPKIVLKAPEKTLLTLIDRYPNVCCPIYDAGLTRVESGSLTVVGFLLEADEIVKELTQLKLL